jgi:hypothetical protein
LARIDAEPHHRKTTRLHLIMSILVPSSPVKHHKKIQKHDAASSLLSLRETPVLLMPSLDKQGMSKKSRNAS